MESQQQEKSQLNLLLTQSGMKCNLFWCLSLCLWQIIGHILIRGQCKANCNPIITNIAAKKNRLSPHAWFCSRFLPAKGQFFLPLLLVGGQLLGFCKMHRDNHDCNKCRINTNEVNYWTEWKGIEKKMTLQTHHGCTVKQILPLSFLFSS